MNAKTVIASALVSMAAFVGDPIPQATASILTNHSGTICKNYNDGEADRIEYLAKGTRSVKAGATQIICPLAREFSYDVGYGTVVYVDLQHTGNQKTTCTVYSHNSNGSLLESYTGSSTGSGSREIVFYLDDAYSWSDLAVLCTIPGSRKAIIMGVDLEQLGEGEYPDF